MSKLMEWVDARFPATKMWEDHLSKYYAPKNFNFFYFFGSLALLVLGYFLEWAFYSYLYEREHLQQVLMTYGLILVFEELRSLIIGDDVHGVSAPDFLSGSIALGDTMTYPVYRLFMSALCISLAIGMYLVFTRTRLGMMIRAGSSNREMVQSLGVDIQFLFIS